MTAKRSGKHVKAGRATKEQYEAWVKTVDGRALGAMTKAEEQFEFARLALSLSRRVGQLGTEELTGQMSELYDEGGTRDDALRLLADVQSKLPTFQ